MKARKKIWCCFVFIIAGVFLLAGCTYTAGQSYMDFLVDLNITERFEDCFSAVEKERAGKFTIAELKTLQEDISFWNKELDDADAANELYVETAEYLIESIEYKQQDDKQQADKSLERARESYRGAQRQLHAISIGDGNGR